jgi:hypothetical protein
LPGHLRPKGAPLPERDPRADASRRPRMTMVVYARFFLS